MFGAHFFKTDFFSLSLSLSSLFSCLDWRGCILCDDAVYIDHGAELNDLFGSDGAGGGAAAAAAAGSNNLLRANLGNRSRRSRRTNPSSSTNTTAENIVPTAKSLTKLFFEPQAVLAAIFSTTTGAGAGEDLNPSQVTLSQEESNIRSMSLEQRMEILSTTRERVSTEQVELDTMERDIITLQNLIGTRTSSLHELQQQQKIQQGRLKKYRMIEQTQGQETYRLDKRSGELREELRRTVRALSHLDEKDSKARDRKESSGVGSPYSSHLSTLLPFSMPTYLSSSHQYLSLAGVDFWLDMLLLDPNLLGYLHHTLTGQNVAEVKNTNGIDLVELGINQFASLTPTTHNATPAASSASGTSDPTSASGLASGSTTTASTAIPNANSTARTILDDMTRMARTDPKLQARGRAADDSEADPSIGAAALTADSEPSDSLLNQSRRTCTSLQSALLDLFHSFAGDPHTFLQSASDVRSRHSRLLATVSTNSQRRQQLERQIREVEIEIEKLNRDNQSSELQLGQTPKPVEQVQVATQTTQQSQPRKKPRLHDNTLMTNHANYDQRHASNDAPSRTHSDAARRTVASAPHASSSSSSSARSMFGSTLPQPLDLTNSSSESDDGGPAPMEIDTRHVEVEEEQMRASEEIDDDEGGANTDRADEQSSPPQRSITAKTLPPPASTASSAPAVHPLPVPHSRNAFLLHSSAPTSKLRLAAALEAVERLDANQAARSDVTIGEIVTLAAADGAERTKNDLLNRESSSSSSNKTNPFGLKSNPTNRNRDHATIASTMSGSIGIAAGQRAPRTIGGDLITRGHDGMGGHVVVLRSALPIDPMKQQKKAKEAKDKTNAQLPSHPSNHTSGTATLPSTPSFSIDQLAYRPKSIQSVNTKTNVQASTNKLNRTGSTTTATSLTTTKNSSSSIRPAPPSRPSVPSRTASGHDIVDLVDDDDDDPPPTHPFFATAQQRSASATTTPTTMRGFTNVTHARKDTNQHGDANTCATTTRQQRTPLASINTNVST